MSQGLPIYNAILAWAAMVCLLATASLVWEWKRWRQTNRRFSVALALLWALALTSAALTGYAFWFNYARTQPLPLKLQLAAGAEFQRETGRHADGAPWVAHLAKVELARAYVRVANPPELHNSAAGATVEYEAATPSQLLRREEAQIIINGDFFAPWRDNGPWDYYPHVGDPVHTRGATVIDGRQVLQTEPPKQPSANLVLTAGGKASFVSSAAGLEAAGADQSLAGLGMLVMEGRAAPPLGIAAFHEKRHPRTVVGLDATGTHLLLLVVDGRQPGYSMGMTWVETAQYCLAAGMHNALMLDGGGSSTMVLEDPNSGKPRVMNSPMHNTIPGCERPIANGLAVFLR